MTNNSAKNMEQGYVYILISPAFPDLLKIGMTTRTPEERAKELSKGTGLPASFVVAYSEFVNNCSLAESLIHQKLVKHRYMQNREFFKLSLKDAIRTIEDILRSSGLVYDIERELREWWFSLNERWQRMFRKALHPVESFVEGWEELIPTQDDLDSIQYFHCYDGDVRNLNPLLRLPNLSNLTIGCPDDFLNIQDFSALKKLTKITELCLSFVKPFETDLTPIGQLQSLRYLSCENLPLQIVADLQQLEYLCIRVDIDADYEFLVKLQDLQTLSLVINCNFGYKIVTHNFQPLGCLSKLQELRICDDAAIYGYEKYLDTNDFRSICHLRQLKKLDLSCGGLLNPDFLSPLENLESLSIHADFVTTPDFSLLGNLVELKLTGTSMYHEQRERFSLESLIGLRNLRSLRLVVAKFYDFSALYALSLLEEIDLSGTEIVDLVPLYSLSNLKKLRIFGMPLLYPKQVQEFQEANPNCEVEYSQNFNHT